MASNSYALRKTYNDDSNGQNWIECFTTYEEAVDSLVLDANSVPGFSVGRFDKTIGEYEYGTERSIYDAEGDCVWEPGQWEPSNQEFSAGDFTLCIIAV